MAFFDPALHPPERPKRRQIDRGRRVQLVQATQECRNLGCRSILGGLRHRLRKGHHTPVSANWLFDQQRTRRRKADGCKPPRHLDLTSRVSLVNRRAGDPGNHTIREPVNGVLTEPNQLGAISRQPHSRARGGQDRGATLGRQLAEPTTSCFVGRVDRHACQSAESSPPIRPVRPTSDQQKQPRTDTAPPCPPLRLLGHPSPAGTIQPTQRMWGAPQYVGTHVARRERSRR